MPLLVKLRATNAALILCSAVLCLLIIVCLCYGICEAMERRPGSEAATDAKQVVETTSVPEVVVVEVVH